MMEFKTGDIFHEDVEALVNTVNCVGVMGRGVALQFKNRFPENFKEYAKACKREEVQPGRMFVFKTNMLTNPRYIINFPTKRHWRGKSRMEDIEAGLDDLIQVIRRYDIRSIAIPPLGSGLGGLDWKEVRRRIEDKLQVLDNQVRIIVFEPGNAPRDKRNTKASRVPSMTPGRAALISLMDRYLRGLLDPFITLLEVHKLMYFLKEAGDESVVRLKVVKGPYGPYAENLRHVLKEIEGYYIAGYQDGGDAPGKPLELVPGATSDAEKLLREHGQTLRNLEKVGRLIKGFETPFGMELLGTVHWVMRKEGACTLNEIITRTYEWNPRKRQFSPYQIEVAARTLHEQGWAELDEVSA